MITLLIPLYDRVSEYIETAKQQNQQMNLLSKEEMIIPTKKLSGYKNNYPFMHIT